MRSPRSALPWWRRKVDTIRIPMDEAPGAEPTADAESEGGRELMVDDSLRVEEYRHDGELVVRVELPGIEPERDVDISLADHTLHIRAERRQDTTAEET